MTRPKVRVQYMVASHTVRQYGTNPTSDLLGVAYRIVYPPDTEFPVTVGQIDLFTRFYIRTAASDDFFVRLWSVGTDGLPEGLIDTFGPYHVDFPSDRTVLDRSFRVKYMTVARPGRYALCLSRRRNSNWRGDRWAVLATEYIAIERG